MRSGSGAGGSRRWLRRGGIFLAVVAGLAGLREVWEFYEYRWIPKRFGVVEEDTVYRSGQIHHNIIRDVLQEHEIRTIVDLTGPNHRDPREQEEVEAARDLGIDYVRLHLKGDGTGNLDHYEEAVARMDGAWEEGEPLLVHCGAGTHRAGVAVAFFRLLVQGWSTERTLEEMEDYSFDLEDDVEGLRYLDRHMATMAERLARRGVITRVPDTLPRVQVES